MAGCLLFPKSPLGSSYSGKRRSALDSGAMYHFRSSHKLLTYPDEKVNVTHNAFMWLSDTGLVMLLNVYLCVFLEPTCEVMGA